MKIIFRDQDEIWGNSIGIINNNNKSLHDVRSVSKSFVSACIGIAIAQGKIKNEEQNIWDFFPEYNSLKTAENSILTIKDLLTMSSGLDWNETTVSYTDSANSETQMDNSPDQIKYVLSRKSVAAPGTKWNYCGGNTQVLAGIIKKVNGLEIDEYANEYLFKPLGIAQFSWTKYHSTLTRKGTPIACGGLRICSRDMLKFGLLYISNGKWKGKQIISADWIERSLQYYMTARERSISTSYYAYHFWGSNININNSPVKAFGAIGNGGQCIIMVPSLEIIIVVTAGNYNSDNDRSYEMIANEIYPAIK